MLVLYHFIVVYSLMLNIQASILMSLCTGLNNNDLFPHGFHSICFDLLEKEKWKCTALKVLCVVWHEWGEYFIGRLLALPHSPFKHSIWATFCRLGVAGCLKIYCLYSCSLRNEAMALWRLHSSIRERATCKVSKYHNPGTAMKDGFRFRVMSRNL